MMNFIYLTLTDDELFMLLIRGLVVGSISGSISGFIGGYFAIFIYRRKRTTEHKANTRDNAAILLDEMIRISGLVEANEMHAVRRPNIAPPGNEIYSGLLLSGNIKYFQTDLRKKLAGFYDQFKIDPFSPDPTLCVEILTDLEYMKDK